MINQLSTIMKKRLSLILLATICVATSLTTAQAQSQTVLTVDIVAQKEVTYAGPYARFAQKFLGVIAPLSDKSTYTILEGRIALQGDAGSEAASEVASATALPTPAITMTSHRYSDTTFVKVPIDKRSSINQTPESMAQDAANTIFLLRKRRIELITGEAGEHVFGAGLSSALAALDRVEEEYLALFMGKQYTETIVKSYNITPETNAQTAVVCRFTESAGLLASDDLTGRPVLLEFTPTEASQPLPVASKSDKNITYKRIAGEVACRLTEGSTLYGSAQLPIYQFGKYIAVPIAK